MKQVSDANIDEKDLVQSDPEIDVYQSSYKVFQRNYYASYIGISIIDTLLEFTF